MRRSAAPSQLGNAAKRPRFISPMFNAPVEKTTDKHTSLNSLDTESPSKRCVTDVLQLVQSGNSAGSSQRVPLKKHVSTSSRMCGTSQCSTTQAGSVSSSLDQVTDFQDYEENISVNDNSNSSPIQLTVHSIKHSSGVFHNNDRHCLEQNYAQPDRDQDRTVESSCTDVNGSSGVAAQKPLRKPGFRTFRPPTSVGNTSVAGSGALHTSPKDNQSTEVSHCRFFSVMWCKRSNKKHKKWEGDAILKTRGRTAILLDMEGKEIGKSSGYKTKELETLSEGQTLAIGGKEIEVMGIISEENYKSGKCFEGAGSTKVEPSKPLSTGISKPFVKPLLSTGANTLSRPITGNQLQSTEMNSKPRFDPTAPNALVMPRPKQEHQWEHNPGHMPVVDVVVDPHVSQHLRPHQREGVIFLYECVNGMKDYSGSGAILADEMGLGKTLQCITLIWTLYKQGPYGGRPLIKRTLIITPGSLTKNWVKEFRKWLGNERIKVFAIDQDNKIEDFKNTSIYPVMVISYEMFVRNIDTARQLKFDLIVCDEGHRLKNSNIKTTSFLQSMPSRKRIILTGTPLQNDLQELFSIADFCNPGILGSLSAFKRVYEEPILSSRQPDIDDETAALGQNRATELNRITSMFILRRTQEINNKYLPPKVEVVLFCQASRLQLDLYNQLLSSRAVRSCFCSTHDTAQHLMCIAALRKLCNHPVLIHKNALEAQSKSTDEIEDQLYGNTFQLYPADVDATALSGKLLVLAEMLERLHHCPQRQRVVVVSNYTQTLDVIEKLCRSLNYQFLRLDGQTATSKRQQLVERFNSTYSQDFVFLLSSKAGGVGLNLIGASRLILFDIDWNPANDLQAMARVWRDGQKNRVYIYRLLTTGTIEEKIYQRQISKQGLSGVVVDSKASNQPHFTTAELRDLFTLQSDTKSATHDLLNCQCDRSAQENTKYDIISNLTSVQHGHTNPQRACQLRVQTTKRSNQGNVCMDELLKWRHIPGPRPSLKQVDDVMLTDDMDQVTFAFFTQSNMQ